MSNVRTDRYFKQVPDFEKDENGNVIKFEHPLDNILAIEQRAREHLIAIEKLTLLRKRVHACYKEEGVNHYENCKEIVQEYCNAVRAPKVGALYAQKKE